MALPGLKGMHHVGVTVPAIEEAVAFFVDVIGCERVLDLPAVSGEGTWMREHLGVHPDAVLEAITFLRCGQGANIELFRWSSPDRRTEAPGNADIGSTHLAFEVDDVAAAVAVLRERGIEVLGEPKLVEEGPRAGVVWVYVRAPWGLQLELISPPTATIGGRELWSPSEPAA